MACPCLARLGAPRAATPPFPPSLAPSLQAEWGRKTRLKLDVGGVPMGQRVRVRVTARNGCGSSAAAVVEVEVAHAVECDVGAAGRQRYLRSEVFKNYYCLSAAVSRKWGEGTGGDKRRSGRKGKGRKGGGKGGGRAM